MEAFRDETGLPKQRTVATLGRLYQLNSGLDSVISGLLRVTGRKMPQGSPPEVEFESARDFGDVLGDYPEARIPLTTANPHA